VITQNPAGLNSDANKFNTIVWIANDPPHTTVSYDDANFTANYVYLTDTHASGSIEATIPEEPIVSGMGGLVGAIFDESDIDEVNALERDSNVVTIVHALALPTYLSPANPTGANGGVVGLSDPATDMGCVDSFYVDDWNPSGTGDDTDGIDGDACPTGSHPITVEQRSLPNTYRSELDGGAGLVTESFDLAVMPVGDAASVWSFDETRNPPMQLNSSVYKTIPERFVAPMRLPPP
jgi:hypothetical protein